MSREASLVKPSASPEDKVLELTLRPKTWQDYVGQDKIKENLRIMLEAAKLRREAPEHLLFYGASGLGKTTLSHLIAKEIGGSMKITSGPAIERAGDLAAILTNLAPGDVLFCDEIHRLNRITEEYLYPAMEEFKLHLVLGKGPMARTMELEVPRFTLIGATTRLALLSSPLRSRFGATFQLNFYQPDDIKKIIRRSAGLLNIRIEPEAVEAIASRARFTPRVANRLLKRVRDFVQVRGAGVISRSLAKEALDFLEIDPQGLEPGDRKVLETLIKKFEGGPVGLQALAAASNEEEDTILDVYEPYLVQLGFIERTPRGRIAAKPAYQHLGLKYKGPARLL